MLQAQATNVQFNLASISAKLGIGAASVSLTAEKQAQTLVGDTVSLLKSLEKKNAVKPSDLLPRLEKSCFYHDQGIWKNGLFKFDSMCSQPTVIYALWRVLKGSLILLIGSPNNILGEKIVAGDCYIPGTSDAHLNILRFIDDSFRFDESVAVRTEPANTYGDDLPVPEASNSTIVFSSAPKSREEVFNRMRSHKAEDELVFIPNERGVNLAFLCLRQLSQLADTHIDTVFRIFSIHDIPKLDDTEHFESSWRFDAKELVEQAQDLGIFDFDRVYLGSPVYTALQ